MAARSSTKYRAMDTLLGRISPSITNMIRMDHSHVLTTFHQYEADAPPDAVGDPRGFLDLDAFRRRQALGRSIRKCSVGPDPPAIDPGIFSRNEDRFQSRVEPSSPRSGTAWKALDRFPHER